ncbi:MAG TPA: NAD(P)-dependent alcohol dehydrogenase [Planosporangium sp.]|nr:NAD(P)-dependent alcohol dehydrogenase [Planosporangium sp.]
MPDNVAAVLHGTGDLRIDPRPVPALGPNDVLVEVRSVGVCGSDVHYYEHGRIGDHVVREPMVLGHETSGVVVDRGALADRHATGQRVALEPGVPCGQCRECRQGRYNLCPDVRFFATPPVDGSMARYVAIQQDFAHPVPDELSDDAAALIEPLSVGIWANRKAGTTVGSRVLVTGAGPIGVLAAQVARAAAAAHVAIVDVNPDRLATAAALGVDETIDARQPADLAAADPDILIECTGVAPVVRAGIHALRPAGTAVLVGMSADPDMPLPVARIQSRELTVTGTFRYAHTYPDAIALAASGRVRLDDLVGARLPLEQAEAALRMGRTDPSVLKTVVTVSP